jgi:hypothetical protein
MATHCQCPHNLRLVTATKNMPELPVPILLCDGRLSGSVRQGRYMLQYGWPAANQYQNHK